MSFAQKFAAGQQIAKTALDTYDTARKKRELSDIMQAKPETLAPVSDLTPAPEATTNPDGTPAVPVLGARQSTPKQYKFLGNTYDTELTPEQQASLRYERLADVVGKDDPVRGLEMRRAITRDKRDDTEFGWKVSDRATAEKLKTGRRDYFNKINGMSDEDLTQHVGGSFSKDGSGIDAMLVFDPATRSHILASNVPGFPTQRLSREEVLNKAMGIWETGNGDFDAGMQRALNTIKTQRELQARNLEVSAGIAKANADNYYKGRSADNDDARVALTREQVGIQRAQLGASQRQNNKPDYALMEDANGNAVMVDKRALKTDANGVVALPQGLRLPRKNQGMEVNADGSVIHNGQLYVPDPKVQGKFVPAKGIGLSAVDKALEAYLAKPTGMGPVTNGSFTPIPRQNITARTPAGYGNPENFERRSSRGLFGGVSYEYYDPSTGKSLSTAEYNRLIGGK